MEERNPLYQLIYDLKFRRTSRDLYLNVDRPSLLTVGTVQSSDKHVGCFLDTGAY
jgi:hypothetical protein